MSSKSSGTDDEAGLNFVALQRCYDGAHLLLVLGVAVLHPH